MRLPPSCPRPSAHCNSSKFVQVQTERANPLADNSSPENDVSDYCEVRVSEVNYSRNPHRLPRSIWVGLEDDLVGVCKPGDEVQVLYGKFEHFFFYIVLLSLRVLIPSVQWCSCPPLPTIARGPACCARDCNARLFREGSQQGTHSIPDSHFRGIFVFRPHDITVE